jgi:hypothetical protein
MPPRRHGRMTLFFANLVLAGQINSARTTAQTRRR